MADEAEELQTIMSNVQQDFARLQRHHGIKTGAKEAQRANARLAQLEAINEKAPRGVLATGIVTGKGAADLMGLSTEVLGLKKDATAVEVLQSLGQLSEADVVQITKGAMSRAELQQFLEAVPQLGTSQQGSKQVLEFMKALNARKTAIAGVADMYRQENGTLDDGFVHDVEAVHDSMPLMPPAQPPTQQG